MCGLCVWCVCYVCGVCDWVCVPPQVLQILPSVWPISTVKSFLMHSLRSSIDTSRTIKIEKNLGKGENLQVCEGRGGSVREGEGPKEWKKPKV